MLGLDEILYSLLSIAENFWAGLDTHFEGLRGPALSAALAALVAIFVLRVNSAINIRNKRMDVIIHCNNRYDELYKMRIDIEAADGDKAQDERIKAYFRRYWGLKSDQLDYWFAGYVDPETLASWFMYTVDSIKGSSTIGGKGYASRWAEDKKEHEVVNQRLVEIMDFIIKFASRIECPVDRYAVILEYFVILEHNERMIIDDLARERPKRLKFRVFSWTLRSDYMRAHDRISTAPRWRAISNSIGRSIARAKHFKKPIKRKRSQRRFEELKQKVQNLHSYKPPPIERGSDD